MKYPLILLFLSLAFASSYSKEESVLAKLSGSKQLTYVGMNFPFDGGSLCFEFITDRGEYLYVFALHNDSSMGGQKNYNMVSIQNTWSGRGKVNIQEGGKLESKLLALLKEAKVGKVTDSTKSSTQKPRRTDLKWLFKRLKERRKHPLFPLADKKDDKPKTESEQGRPAKAGQ